MVLHQNEAIRMLLAAERRAVTKIAEARKRKERRAHQARDEARKEVMRFERQMERDFREFQRSAGATMTAITQIEHRTAMRIVEVQQEAAIYSQGVIEQLLKLLWDVRPTMHRNFRTLFLKTPTQQEYQRQSMIRSLSWV